VNPCGKSSRYGAGVFFRMTMNFFVVGPEV